MKEVTNEEFLAMQENDEKIMVDIWAEWCGPCKMLKPILNNITVPENVNLISLDSDKYIDVVRQLNVKSLPTVILFKGKTEIKRIVGLHTYNEYDNEIKNFSEQ